MPTVTRLFGKFRLSLGVLAAVLAGTPALAAFGSFSIPVGSAFAVNGATAGSTISLPNSTVPGFLINFALPRDYQKDGEVRITFYLQVANGNCSVRFEANQLIRIRPGTAPVAGLAGLTGNPVTPMPAGAGVIVSRTFFLKPGNALPEQRVGDAFSVTFIRSASAAADTCGDALVVRAINILYTLKP